MKSANFLRTGLMSLSAAALLVPAILPWSASAATSQPFGLYQSTNNLNYTIGSSPQYDSAIQYYGWNENPQSAQISALPTSVTPFLELQTCGNPCNKSNETTLSSIIAGNSDAYLTSYASSLATINRKVLLTFDHEQNGSWYPWDWYTGNTEFTSQANQQSLWIQA